MSHERGHKTARQPSRVDLELLSSCHLCPRACCEILTGIITHVLYVRGQIPGVYETLVKVQGDYTTVRKGQRRRHAIRQAKALGQVTELLQSITPCLFRGTSYTDCLLLLGKSALRPRESFHLRFHHSAEGSCPDEKAVHNPISYGNNNSRLPPSVHATNIEEGAYQKLVRTCLRQMLLQLADSESSLTRPTRLHLLIFSGMDVPPPGFAPRQGLRLRQRKGLDIRGKVGQQYRNSETAVAGAALPQGHAEEVETNDSMNLIDQPWLQSTAKVKGWSALTD